MAKRRKAEAVFALLFALLAILHLVYRLHHEQTKYTNSKVVCWFAVEERQNV